MKARPLALVAILLLALSAVVYWATSSDPVPVLDPGAHGAVSPNAGDELRAEKGTLSTDTEHGKAAGGVQRQQLVDPDAKWNAALSGFTGRLVDPRKLPLADRVVRFLRIDPEQFMRYRGVFEEATEAEAPHLEIQEGRTGADGRFRVTGAWPHAVFVLEADAEGPDRRPILVDRSPAPGEIIDLGDIELQPLGVIVGRVVDESGKAVPGAEVRAADIPGSYLDLAPVERFDPEGGVIVRETQKPMVIEMPGWVKSTYEKYVRPRTFSGEDGRFRLEGVFPGTNVLVVNKREFEPLIRKGLRVESGKEKDAGQLKLGEGQEAFVRVLDLEDHPVAGAEVMIAATTIPFGVDFASRVGTTNAKGELCSLGWPRGRVTVAARRSRSHPWVVLEPVNVSSDIEVRLPSRFHLDIAVKSASGKEVTSPEFKLMPTAEQGMGLEIAVMGFVRWLDVDDKVSRLEDGRYRISDLVPGRYSLAVRADGHAGAKVDFEIKKSAEAEILLRSESPFEVLVIDQEKQPVRRAKIYIKAGRPAQGERLLDMPIVAGETDEEGRLEVRDGQPGKMRISASHPAFGYAHREFELPTAEPVVLTLITPGELQVLITENGREPELGKWTVVLEPRMWSDRGAMPDMPKFNTPDLEGRFVARGLRPGKYRVRVMTSLSALNSPGGMIGFMMQARLLRNTVFKDVEIQSGQRTAIELEAVKQAEVIEGPSARVSGTVLVNNRPVAQLFVTARGQRRFGVKTDEAGRFDLGQVPVGVMRLEVRDAAQAQAVDMRMESHLWRNDAVKVEEGKDLVLDIQIRTGRVSGTILLQSGRPAQMVKVQISGKRKQDGEKAPPIRAKAITSTDANGQFHFDQLPTGSYELEVQDRQKGYGQLGGIEVHESGLVSGLRLSLHQTYEISGKVDLSSVLADRPDWCYLQFRGEGRAEQQGASVRRDGSFRVRGLPSGTYVVEMHFPMPGNGHQQAPAAQKLLLGEKNLEDVVLIPDMSPRGGSEQRK